MCTNLTFELVNCVLPTRNGGKLRKHIFRHFVVDNEVFVCTLHMQEPSLQFENIDLIRIRGGALF